MKTGKIKLENALQELWKTWELIEEKNRQLEAQSRFFANISHEFRTPLALIMGPLEQMLNSNPDKETRSKVEMMLRNSHRLLELVNQLLELAKFDSGKMQLQASMQDIVPFVKNAAMCFNALARLNKVDFDFHGESNQVPVYFDADKLEKIIINLLSNAFNHTPGGGKITVSVRKAAAHPDFPTGSVEISVHNTGPGIPPDQLPHIFNRFFRGKPGHDYKRKGIGIGLALTKELVELHHGKIEVHSKCNHDNTGETEFVLRLPMGGEHLQPGETMQTGETRQRPALIESWHPAPGDAQTGQKETETEADPENGKKDKPLVLVVEDESDVRAYVKSGLGSRFQVVEAGDGSEGIHQAKEIIPDIIISDITMPGPDGFELCRTLKNHVLTSHIPIILLTARVSEEYVLQGVETGADDYITKPFSTALLAVRVRNLLDLRRQLQLERTDCMRLQPEKLTVSSLDHEFYKILQNTVESNISSLDFNVEALSRALGISQATLYRKVLALTGTTPVRFIRCCRLRLSARLLEAGAGSVSEVALKVGFPDISYFARCFKEQFHRLPSGYLPQGTGAAEVPDETAPGSDVDTDPQEPGKELILVVEDDKDFRQYLLEMLDPDYRVVEAVDGSAGIAAALEMIPDLVISDIMMPGSDGLQLCARLKNDARTSHIPIVLLTGVASEESRIRGFETGADDYIAKPFNASILDARIRHLIRLRSHLQEMRIREIKMLPVHVSESNTDREFINDLHAVMQTGISDPDFNVRLLAGKLYMSSASLYRKVLGLTGETPSQYIRSYRLQQAAQLLKDHFGSVADVAFEVGFSSAAYFTRCFREMFHCSPSEYAAVES
jgi:DNA-binding response OmpR family regulator/nitrogen-specific signal transduction histidine kinase